MVVNYKCCVAVLVILYVSVQPSSQQEVNYDDIETLYYPGDNVTIFHAGNLKQSLTTSKTMWLVEYYSSWCGHCHEFAPVFKALAKDISGWSWIFRLGAMNCGAVAPNGEENYLVCHRSPYWVFEYPDFRFYPSMADENNKGDMLDENGLIHMKDYRGEILKYIEKNLPNLEWEHDTKKPNLTAITSEKDAVAEVDEYMATDVEYLALVFEDAQDTMGKEILLDMSSCNNITTLRIALNSPAATYLAYDFNITLPTDGEAHVAVISKNTSVINVDVKMKTRYFYVYKLQRLPGVGEPTAKEVVAISADIRNPLLSDASGRKININELDRYYSMFKKRTRQSGIRQMKPRRRHTEL